MTEKQKNILVALLASAEKDYPTEKDIECNWYDYRAAMYYDILQNINENCYDTDNRDELEETLNDDLWTADDVTGNASGSYTFSSWKAEKMVLDNMDTLREALEEFSTDAETIANDFLSGNWESMDVTIRCYLLGSVVADALNDMEGADFFQLEEGESND